MFFFVFFPVLGNTRKFSKKEKNFLIKFFFRFFLIFFNFFFSELENGIFDFETEI